MAQAASPRLLPWPAPSRARPQACLRGRQPVSLPRSSAVLAGEREPRVRRPGPAPVRWKLRQNEAERQGYAESETDFVEKSLLLIPNIALRVSAADGSVAVTFMVPGLDRTGCRVVCVLAHHDQCQSPVSIVQLALRLGGVGRGRFPATEVVNAQGKREPKRSCRWAGTVTRSKLFSSFHGAVARDVGRRRRAASRRASPPRHHRPPTCS